MSAKNELLDYKERILAAVEAQDVAAAEAIDSILALEGWEVADVDNFVRKNTMVFEQWKELVER